MFITFFFIFGLNLPRKVPKNGLIETLDHND